MNRNEKIATAVIVLVPLGLAAFLFPIGMGIGAGIAALLGLGVWPLIIKDKVPLWMWRVDVEEKSVPVGDTEKTVKYERTVIFGILEVRHLLDDNVVWVVRPSMGLNLDDKFTEDMSPEERQEVLESYRNERRRFNAEAVIGYQEKVNGWHWIWFPELLWFTVKMIDKRPINLDPKAFEMNTQAGKVKFDTQVTVRVSRVPGSAAKFAIRAKDAVREIVFQYLSAAANYITSGVTDVELVNLKAGQVARLGAMGSQILNQARATTAITRSDEGKAEHEVVFVETDGDEESEIPEGSVIDAIEGLPYASLGDYGLVATVRIQTISASRETMDAINRQVVAEIETKTHEELANRVAALVALGVDPRYATVLEYLRPSMEIAASMVGLKIQGNGKGKSKSKDEEDSDETKEKKEK